MLRSVDGWESEHFAFGEAEASPAAAPTAIAIDHGAEGPTATIPDAHLLFTAQFSRAGSDLLLKGEDGKAFVVQDYFNSDDRARLLSPEGAALSPDVIAALAGPMAAGQYAQAGAAAPANEAVGRIAQVTGDATIVRNGVAVVANAGDPLLKGDVLQTVSGTIGATFNDGSTLNLTANTRLVVNEFVYDPRGSANSQLLDLVQGSLTFISGEIAHNGNMRIGTPVATMGIRGTVGGVTTASDGTVSFYVSQSATGAVILDSTGRIVANVVQDGPMIIVRPVGPLQIIAEEIQKTPGQLATELAALQTILNIKAIGDQILQQNQQQNPNDPPPPNPQSTDKPLTQFQTYKIDLPASLPAESKGDDSSAPPPVVKITETTTDDDGNQTTHTEYVPLPPNLTPINFAPLTLAMNEDGTLVLSSANQNAITVSDDGPGSLTVTLKATNGTMSLNGVAGLTFSAGDGSGDATMTFSGSQAAINAALNGMSLVPHENYNGPATISISTSDGNSSSGETVVAVNVGAVNDAPVLDYFNLTVTEGGVTVLSEGNFHVTDPDSTDFVFTVTNVTGGHFEVDGEENALFATFSDEAPTSITFTSDDIAHGRVRFIHNGGEAPPSFRVTVSDGEAESEAVGVSVDFTNVNTAPVVTPIEQTATEDDAPVTIDGLAAAYDQDPDDTLTIDLSTAVLTVTDGQGQPLPRPVIYTLNGSSMTVDPAQFNYLGAGEQAVLHATYEVVDSSGERVQTSATLTITGVNDGPAIVSNGGGGSAFLFVAENTTGVTTVAATDVDSPDTVYSIVGGPDAARFAIDPESGVLSFVSQQNYEHPADANHSGLYTVQVQASDGSLTDVQTLYVRVTDVNETPKITSGGGQDGTSVTVNENQRGVTTIRADDPDFGDDVRFSIVSDSDSPDAGKFTINAYTGELSFRNAPNHENPTDVGGDNNYVVKVRASDGPLSDTQILTVTVRDVNEAPAIDGGSSRTVYVAENSTDVTAVHASDVEGARITYSIVHGNDSPDWGKFTINANTGVLSFVALQNYENPGDSNHNGTYTVQVRASDGSLSDVQTLSVRLTDVNETPKITSGGGQDETSITVNENQRSVTTVRADDPDRGDDVRFSIVSDSDPASPDAGKFTINSYTGELSFRNAPDRENPTDANGDSIYIVKVRASDGALSDTQIVSVTVRNVNEAPVIDGGSNRTVYVAENATEVTAVNAEDVEGARVTYSIVRGYDSPDSGKFIIDPNTGVLSFTSLQNYENPADSNHNGIYTLQVRASDGSLSDVQTLSVRLTDVNETPTNTVPGAQTVDEDTDLSIAGLSVADADRGSLTTTLSVTSGILVVAAVTGGATVGGSGTGTVTLTGSAAQINAVLGALDNVVYRDAANASGAHTLTVSTSDGTLTATDTVAIDVNPVNDAPVIAMALLDENFDGENGGSSAAQYINFANWIPNDFTDLIGTGSNQNFYPGNGLYVDLAGSNSGPATLTSRTEYSAGLYTLKFEIAGPHRDSVGHNVSSGGETDTVRVTFGDYSEDFYLDTGATLSVTRQVTLDAAASLSIGSLGGPVNPNIGAILFGASVSKVDAAPTISYVEGQAAQAINAVLTLSDLDNATFSGATVQITGNFHAAEDSLVFANQNGITGSYDSSLGVLILTGVASVAAYQAALRSVAYANSSDDPSTGARTIGFQVDDGGDANNLSAVVSATVNVTAVNDAPVAHNDAATTSLNALLTVAAASGLLANDTDPDSADTLTVTQINGQHFSEGNAIDLAHGTLTVATDGSYSFQPTQGFSGTQTFDYTVSDGHVTDTATATLTVDNNYVLTFDDTAGGLGSFLPGGYGGLTWSNIYVLSGDLYAPRSGYAHGTVSDPNVAYNGNGTPAIVSGDEFNFVGADLTAAWNTGLSIQVDGFHEGSRIYSQTVTVDYSAPTWFAFNYTNIDHLVFLSSGGTWADLGGSGTHFAMDNFTWSPVGADPIILDLGAPGISLTPVPVAFDLNADGVKESIGWTSGEDGILVSDLDHSGSIENGHEVFSPVFGTAGFADALAALASLDGNRDGVIDARDASFRDIAVWQDANHDGVSQQGELGSLSDHGIVSLDLNAEPVAEQNGGQEVVALGHVTLSTGATSEYIAVNLQGVPGATVGIGDQSGASTGGAISTAGGDAPVEGDTFHFAPGIGAVTVSHFNVASDTIVLEGYDFVANYDDLFTALESNGDAFHGDAVIDLGNGDSITVAGVSQSYLQQHLDLVHVGSGLV